MDQIPRWSIPGAESFSELDLAELGEIANGPRRFPSRINPINPPLVIARAHVKFCQAVWRNPARMFDDKAIHIDDPQSAVRPGADFHRTEPVVRRSQKFILLLGRRAIAGEGDSLRL